ncbi:MAG: hypothetical protein HQL56_01690 [Magnetococcales bacterium]|nr:hypothetical protein [Magnetococcales bacterium]
MGGGRTVAALAIPGLAVAAVCRREPAVAVCPLAVVGAEGRVVAVNREAWRRGVWPGQAEGRLSAEVVRRRSAEEEENAIRQRVVTRLLAVTPAVEENRRGRWVMDLSGTERLHGQAGVVTLDGLVRELGREFPVVGGVGSGRPVALMAGEAAWRSGLDWLRVLSGQESRFLGPLPVGLLPRMGQRTVARLQRLGVVRIAQLLQCPQEALLRVFGPRAVLWRQVATGQDPLPWRLSDGATQRLTVELEPGLALQKEESLRALVAGGCETLGAGLRQAGHHAVGLGLVWVDWDGVRREKSLRLETAEQGFQGLLEAVWAGLQSLRQRRVMVRRVIIRVERVVAHRPRDLFAPDDEAARRRAGALDRTLDAIRDRFGGNAVKRGILLAAESATTLREVMPR